MKGDQYLHLLFAATSSHLESTLFTNQRPLVAFLLGAQHPEARDRSPPRTARQLSDFTSPVAPDSCGCCRWSGGFIIARACVPLCGHFPGTPPTPGLQPGDLCPTHNCPLRLIALMGTGVTGGVQGAACLAHPGCRPSLPPGEGSRPQMWAHGVNGLLLKRFEVPPPQTPTGSLPVI